MSINRVNITGNLTRDPELRATGSGMSVLHMGVAVNDRRKNQQTGEWVEATDWFRGCSRKWVCPSTTSAVALSRNWSGNRG